MSKLLHVIPISLMLFLSAFTTAKASTTVMQCSLTNGREVNIQWDGSALSYSYGKPGVKPELTLSGDKAHFGHESYASSEGAYYRFTSGNYDYVTYFSETNQGTISNLGIFKDEKLIKEIKCKDYFHSQLSSLYQPVSAAIPVDDGTVDWSVNEGENSSTNIPPSDNAAAEQPQEQQTASSSPVQIKVYDHTSNQSYSTSQTHTVTRHVKIFSLVGSVTITGINIDRGSCYSWKGKPITITYGKSSDTSLVMDAQVNYANVGSWVQYPGKRYNNCMWSEVEVTTDKGNWTFNLN